MILEQKHKYRPMEQDRNPRNKPMHNPCTHLSLTEEARLYNGTKTASSINGDREIQQLHVKE